MAFFDSWANRIGDALRTQFPLMAAIVLRKSDGSADMLGSNGAGALLVANDGIPAAVGTAAMSASMPVTIATDDTVLTGQQSTDDAARAFGTKGVDAHGRYALDESLDTLDDGDAGKIAINARRQVRVDLATLISGEDQTGDRLCTIDTDTRDLHDGVRFRYADYDADTDIVGPKYWRITTPNSLTRIHCKIRGSCGASGGVWQLYENPTLNAAGTAGTARNCDRNSATVATATVFYDTTTTSDGTLVWSGIVGAGGGQVEIPEWVLLANEDYIVKFTATADNTVSDIVFDWIEVTP